MADPTSESFHCLQYNPCPGCKQGNAGFRNSQGLGSLVVPVPLLCARGWHHETRIGTGNQLHHTIIISVSFYGTVAHHLEGKLLLCEGYMKKLLQNWSKFVKKSNFRGLWTVKTRDVIITLVQLFWTFCYWLLINIVRKFLPLAVPCSICHLVVYLLIYLLFSLRNWLTFLLERAPPLVFLLLASGPCLSGLYTVQGYIDVGTFIWGLIGELVRWTEQKKTVFVNVHCICGTASHAVLPLNWLISHVTTRHLVD